MGRSKRTRTRRSAHEWSRILARFERGGQSQREFCEREGLALSTLQWWRRKLRMMGRECAHHDGAWFVELAEDGADRRFPDTISVRTRYRHAGVRSRGATGSSRAPPGISRTSPPRHPPRAEAAGADGNAPGGGQPVQHHRRRVYREHREA